MADYLKKGIQMLKIGQGMSRDLIPDDCFSKEQLFE